LEEIELPINNTSLAYDKNKDTLYIKGEDYRVLLSESSSGFQSLAPLYLVSSYLANRVKNRATPMSIEESKIFQEQVKEIYTNPLLSEEQRRIAINALSFKFNKTSFINIVEEPEQNLFPTSQRDMLYSLLEINNRSKGNKLIITTHSPYLLNYMSVVIKAGKLKQEVTDQRQDEINAIVPISSATEGDDLAIYELNEKSGSIQLLGNYNGIPSDDNLLNLQIDETNNLFADLLDLQQQWQ